MNVCVNGYVGDDRLEFEYFSKYNRINAKGIKDEIYFQVVKKYGYSIAKNFELSSVYRNN